MNRLGKLLGIVAVLFLVVTQAQAADKKAEVMALMDKAIAHFDKVGPDQAYKDFADPKGPYREGEIYIVVQDMQGKIVFHATNPRLIGINSLALKDADGREFNKEMIDGLKKADSLWIKYKWSNPATKKIAQKISFVKKATKDLYFIIGYYE